MRGLFTIAMILFSLSLFSQKVVLEGYVFEENNRGYLNEAFITVLSSSKAIKAETVTNLKGFFSVELEAGQEYTIRAKKNLFFQKEVTVSTKEKSAGDKVYTKIAVKRQPGYLFDVTLAETTWGDDIGGKEALTGTLIEIYNNTKNEEILVLDGHPKPGFAYTFEQGNHYTVMIRKKGYLTKRLEAKVNVEGCILCFEGLSNVEREISDVMTEGMQMGTLVANIELEKVQLNKSVRIENIYYDYNKWDIRPEAAVELDKVVALLKDNPAIVLELGSHTDSRGRDEYNQELSEKRAQSAVNYILTEGNISSERLTARGYGESTLVNRCRNGVKCTEDQHQLNRRTELKIVGYVEGKEEEEFNSLRNIIYEENVDKIISGDAPTEVVEVTGDQLPPEILADIKRQEERRRKEQEGKSSTSSESTSSSTTTTPATPESPRPAPMEKPKLEIAEGPAPAPKEKKEPAFFGRRPKMIDKDYSGYKVELKNAPEELPMSNKLFSLHGNMKYYINKDGSYSYMLGNFKREKDAQKFFDNILSSRYPNAKIIGFENGQRIRN